MTLSLSVCVSVCVAAVKPHATPGCSHIIWTALIGSDRTGSGTQWHRPQTRIRCWARCQSCRELSEVLTATAPSCSVMLTNRIYGAVFLQGGGGCKRLWIGCNWAAAWACSVYSRESDGVRRCGGRNWNKHIFCSLFQACGLKTGAASPVNQTCLSWVYSMCVSCSWRHRLQLTLPLPGLPQLDKKRYIKQSQWCNTGERHTAGLGSLDYPLSNPTVHTCEPSPLPHPAASILSQSLLPFLPHPLSSHQIGIRGSRGSQLLLCASFTLTMLVILHPRRAAEMSPTELPKRKKRKRKGRTKSV